MSSPDYYVFTLYVKDRSPASLKVYERLAQLCFETLPGKYVIKVIDLSEEPAKAVKRNILATPTLVTNLPGPFNTFIEDLSKDQGVRLAIERAK